MNKQHDGYEVILFPKMRRLETNLARMARRKNLIRGLVEVDVTRARQFIREEKARTGESLSFTAFIAACIGRAVAENRQVQAYKNWRGQLVLFDDVDIGILVEREHDGRKFPVAHLVRAANKKTVRAMHEEIRAAQAKPMSGKEVKQVRAITSVPSFVRQMLLWAMSKNPHLLKQNMGTVGLTAIGMFGNRGGWGIDLPINSLGIVVGGIAGRPALVDGKVEAHEYLSLTLNFDHDIIDGAPAARFAQRLCDLIESGYGLYESEASTPFIAQSPGSE
jgi:pyruvate/2-oxoglutarate dehydrogenase complex dihydrolipoamide acyltransferase (E2) component